MEGKYSDDTLIQRLCYLFVFLYLWFFLSAVCFPRFLLSLLSVLYPLLIPLYSTHALCCPFSVTSCLQVWSLDTFSLLQTLLRHEHSVDCIVARGGRIYTGAADSTIKVREGR